MVKMSKYKVLYRATWNYGSLAYDKWFIVYESEKSYWIYDPFSETLSWKPEKIYCKIIRKNTAVKAFARYTKEEALKDLLCRYSIRKEILQSYIDTTNDCLAYIKNINQSNKDNNE